MPNPSKTYFYKEIFKVISSLKSKKNLKKILDVGCGEAQFYPYLKKKEYLGLDIDDVKIKKVKKKYPKCKIKKADFNKIKINKKFDIVLCLEVDSLNRVDSPQKSLHFLNKIISMTSKNGYVLLNFWKIFYFQNKQKIKSILKKNNITIEKKIEYGFFDKNIIFLCWKIIFHLYPILIPFAKLLKKKNVSFVLKKE